MQPQLNINNFVLLVVSLLYLGAGKATPAPLEPNPLENVPDQINSVDGANEGNVPIYVESSHKEARLHGTTQTSTEISTTTTTEFPEYKENCFNAEPDLCQTHFHQTPATHQPIVHYSHQNIDPAACQCRKHPIIANASYCCNITHMSMISSCGNMSFGPKLHIFNMSLPDLDLSHPVYHQKISLSITDGNIRKVGNGFPKMTSIECLNISNNKLTEISPRALSNLPNLKFLDISHNNLTRIPNWNQNKNITVDVRNNPSLSCKLLLEAVFSDSIKFVDPNNSFCLYNYTYHWFNSTDYVSIKELETARRFQTECPVIPGHGNCTCIAEHMLIMADNIKTTAKLFCRVDCSNMSLTELPPKLPENTLSLNISNNNISCFSNNFHSNPSYKSIVKLWADNNKISSIADLEGTEFLRRFQRLNLRNNALTNIPEYLLSNVLEGDVGRTIFLGGNKLHCDCNSAKALKIWLLTRSKDIPDYQEIYCRNMPQRVMELEEGLLCQSPHDWTDYIYYLIAAEVFLLVSLITKVSYDYWIFKTAGYLPWPANKMPKLPCDWLCE